MKDARKIPQFCIAAVGETPQALRDCAERAFGYTRFVELRLDWLDRPEDGLALIPSLAASGAGRNAGLAILQATCRRLENGGRFRGSVAEQLQILHRAAALGCRLADLEIESAEATDPDVVAALRHEVSLILSWHDFHGTPALDSVARRLRRFPADYYKIVPTATRQSDNCAALEFLVAAASGGERWIVFCMGQAGIPSRVLALSRGSAFVYASCPEVGNREQGIGNRRNGRENGAALAAPGQVDFETLRKVYRAEKLSSKTAVYGLLGSPIGHSIGAAIHNASFRARRMDAVYLPLLASSLNDFRKAAKLYPLRGFSVTIPHKQGILRFLDRVDPTVKLAGAANTVRIRRGRWEAINSDVEGIVGPVRKAFRLSQRERLGNGCRAVVVGTGGAARAALAALQKLRCRNVAVMGRDSAKARRLAMDFGVTTMPLASLEAERFDLLIHATPVGMWPRTGECLLRPEQINAAVVFDLVYNPAGTRLLQFARARGCRTISGLDMFIAQAARQFEYWTGAEAPRQLMRKTAERELERFGNGSGPSAGEKKSDD